MYCGKFAQCKNCSVMKTSKHTRNNWIKLGGSQVYDHSSVWRNLR
jgi:hypothetical protein